MVVVEYLVYDDEPDRDRAGNYLGIKPAYGRSGCFKHRKPISLAGTLASECVWIVPGTINPDD